MSQSRRQFLQSMCGGGAVLSLASSMPGFLQRAAWASGPAGGEHDRVLVVLQLSGGNDGLNTVVPYADDAYARGRKTLRLSKRDVLPLDDYQGFHPQMGGFLKLMDSGQLSVLHGVGYPKNNRGHAEAMREWHTGQPGQEECSTGWIGRAVDWAAPPATVDVPAAFVGPIAPPFALRAEKSVVPSVRDLNEWTSPTGLAKRGPMAERHGEGRENPLLDVARRGAQGGARMGEQVEKVLAGDAGGREYPDFTLAGHLRSVSQLIQADLGIRIFFVELGGGGIGGFDNHANQRDNHAALLREMSESIAAFVGDLERRGLLSRVLLMTFSEFGRTVAENGRRGTGHGAAAPLFLAGGGVEGGVVGEHPSLTDLDNGALRFHTDFRRVYATVLGSWLGYDAAAILGDEYPPLGVFV